MPLSSSMPSSSMVKYDRTTLLGLSHKRHRLCRSVRKVLFSHRLWRRQVSSTSHNNNHYNNTISTIITTSNRINYISRGCIKYNCIEIKKTPLPPRYLNLCTVNCRSVNNKSAYLLDHLLHHEADIAAITETWLSGDESRNRIFINECDDYGFRLHHNPRSSQRGGGVGVLVKKGMSVKRQSNVDMATFEYIELFITAVSSHIRLIVIYRPPKLSRAKFVVEFSEFIEKLSVMSGKLLICGDFNINWLNDNDCDHRKLQRLFDCFNLVQHVNVPTHSSGHILDYIIGSSDLVRSCRASDFVSDHCALHVALTCGSNHPDRTHITYRQLKTIDNDLLAKDIEAADFNLDTCDINVVVDTYNSVLTSILNKHAPLKTNSVPCRIIQPWINEDILTTKRIKRKHERLWRKTKLHVHLESFIVVCNKLKYLIRDAKMNFYNMQISNCHGDQKKLFKIVKNLLGHAKHTVLPEHANSLSLATTFNDYFIAKIDGIRNSFPALIDSLPAKPYFTDLHMPFSRNNTTLSCFTPTTLSEIQAILGKMNKTTCLLDPFPTKQLMNYSHLFIHVIVRIVNLSFANGVFPNAFKTAVVKPLLKNPSLDCEVLNNFRPVSNLSFMAKVIEKVIADRLVKHMSNHNMVDKFQSAYKSKHSTETALLRVQNDILFNIDKGNGILLVLLDLSAAFDTIDHSILFHSLENNLGLTGQALSMMKSYLDGRTQCVQIEGVVSELANLICGVPQGSVLGPLKFCIYMLPLGSILNHHNMQYHIYADDTQLYISFDLSCPDIAIKDINSCISDLRCWLVKNKLKINDNKTEFLVLTSSTSKHRYNDLCISVGDSCISSSVNVKNLGVIFDKFLNMDVHISYVCKSVYYHLRNIGKIRNMLSDNACAQLIHSLVTTRLDYCNSLLYGLPDTSLRRLQHIQNIAARILCRLPKFSSIGETLIKLHWLPIKHRITFKILILVYQAYHHTAPAYLCELITPYRCTRVGMRSNEQMLLSVQRARMNRYGERCFQYAGPKEWNALPQAIRNSKSLEVFKSKVKTYLFKKCT